MSQADILAQMRKLEDSKISLPLRVLYPEQIKDGVIETAKIADLAVETVKVKDQAITIPVSAYTEGQITLTKATNNVLQECAIVATGTSIFIMWSVEVYGISAGLNRLGFRIFRDATKIYESWLYTDHTNELVSANMVDTPNSGAHTYYVTCNPLDYNIFAMCRSLGLLEVKK